MNRYITSCKLVNQLKIGLYNKDYEFEIIEKAIFKFFSSYSIKKIIFNDLTVFTINEIPSNSFELCYSISIGYLKEKYNLLEI